MKAKRCAALAAMLVLSALLVMSGAAASGEERFNRVEITTPDGVRYAFAVDAGRLRGDKIVEGQRVTEMDTNVPEWSKTWYLRRHDPAMRRADGKHYPDSLGFDVVSEDGNSVVSYHYDGQYFRCCGWVDRARYAGAVLIEDTTLSYYPAGSETAEYSVDAGDSCTVWASDFEHKPATPDAARARAELLPEQMADDIPGYTLLEWASCGWGGSEVEAGFYRVQNGLLDIKWARYVAEKGMVSQVDMMPVPLSEQMLRRFEQEPAKDLICTRAEGEVFKAEDAVDCEAIPVEGRVVQSDIHSKGLILLTELESGMRRLYWATQDGAGGYRVQATRDLPKGVYLDTFHAANGEVEVEWQEGEAYRQAGYRLAADGTWALEWVMNEAVDGKNQSFGAAYGGVTFWEEDTRVIGSLDGCSLFETDLLSLPHTRAELEAVLVRDGWAVVCNPNPADRLHLRTRPKRDAESLGKFYNGTPVRVLERKDGWCRVEIGLDGHLSGYMMEKFLVFGAEMDGVACAYPQKCFTEAYEGRKVYADAQMTVETVRMEAFDVVGVVEDRLYILLTDDGETGYVPQAWLFDGNG